MRLCNLVSDCEDIVLRLNAKSIVSIFHWQYSRIVGQKINRYKLEIAADKLLCWIHCLQSVQRMFVCRTLPCVTCLAFCCCFRHISLGFFLPFHLKQSSSWWQWPYIPFTYSFSIFPLNVAFYGHGKWVFIFHSSFTCIRSFAHLMVLDAVGIMHTRLSADRYRCMTKEIAWI